MTPKLYKPAEVCEIAQVQPYVLRSWENEFPGIGLRKASDGQRLYRQSDIDQILHIKQLVFGEGLTLAGARRRLEETAPATPAATTVTDDEVAEVLDALASDARTRIASVRQGLQSILTMLSGTPGSRVIVVDEYQLQPPPPADAPAKARTLPARRADARQKPAGRKTAPVRGKTAPPAKRKRASA